MTAVIEKNIPIKKSWGIMSPESLLAQGMKVGDSVSFPTREDAHRFRIYVSRMHGKGAGSMRVEDKNTYRVWRIK